MTGISAGRALAVTGLSLSVLLSVAACGGQSGTERSADATEVGSEVPAASDTPVRPETLDVDRFTPYPPSGSPSSSSSGSPCPASGVRVTAGEANAASGLRAQEVTLTNCGPTARRLSGYPTVELLDEDGKPLRIDIDRGARRVSSGVGDATPAAFSVEPGGSATFQLVWRNTYDDTSQAPVVGKTVVVSPSVGDIGVRITPETPYDLGSTGRLGVTVWEPAR
ncbi:DUF4232 domain-containing protein [Streptomyces pactum]|uniref:DUF4232 domain-containing protein n=1 Tax=Streptomyces pactum TaxID=68249 RepID=A0ABS0NS46_9ACTN|nr:DUF4232 domain-containing protein [Streptomyces pactum]MBH5338015.1 DUF4232 domain-containing protein [Streptomyces pactum]